MSTKIHNEIIFNLISEGANFRVLQWIHGRGAFVKYVPTVLARWLDLGFMIYLDGPEPATGYGRIAHVLTPFANSKLTTAAKVI